MRARFMHKYVFIFIKPLKNILRHLLLPMIWNSEKFTTLLSFKRFVWKRACFRTTNRWLQGVEPILYRYPLSSSLAQWIRQKWNLNGPESFKKYSIVGQEHFRDAVISFSTPCLQLFRSSQLLNSNSWLLFFSLHSMFDVGRSMFSFFQPIAHSPQSIACC